MAPYDLDQMKARMVLRPLDLSLDKVGDEAQPPALTVSEGQKYPIEERLDIVTKNSVYPVIIGQDVLSRIGMYMVDLLHYEPSRHNVLILTDEKVAPYYVSPCRRESPKAGFRFLTVVRPAGEQEKRLAAVEEIISHMIRYGLDRSGVLLALGGGVIGDLGGFIAATYMRGIDFIQIPTTVLAHDSSVGGKVAVNHPLGKNMIGAFYPPRAVFYDMLTFRTLPSREICAGYAELIKHALISGERFYTELIRSREVLLRLCDQRVEEADWPILTRLLSRGIAVKKAVVERDERETSGEREALNIGHTVAHALELTLGYGTLLHGEAVAIGLVVETELALRLGLADASFLAQLETDLTSLHLPTKVPPDVTTEALVQAMLADKKNRHASIHFALLRAPGRVLRVGLAPDDVRTLLEK